MASKFVSALAFLALGVTASPHPGSCKPSTQKPRSPTSSLFPVSNINPDLALMKRSPALCSRIQPQGDVVCGKTGYIKDDSHRWPLPVLKSSIEACAESCSATATCGYFVWREEGFCQIFADKISDAGFFDDSTSLSSWYEMGCFACQLG